MNPRKATPVTISASALAVDIHATPASLSAPVAGGSQSFSLALKNRMGKVTAAAKGLDLGSIRQERGEIAPGEQKFYDVSVPKGASSLRARVDGVAAGADLDVYLLDCTEPEKPEAAPEKSGEKDKGNMSPMRPAPVCGTSAKASDVGPGGEVSVTNPKAGRWVVVVDAYSSPGPTSYAYVDVFTDPRFGSVSAADFPEERGPSSTWTSPSNAWTVRLPEPPRRLGTVVTATSRDVTQAGGRFGAGDKESVPLGWTEIVFGDANGSTGGSH